jgi:hypothetical protein
MQTYYLNSMGVCTWQQRGAVSEAVVQYQAFQLVHQIHQVWLVVPAADCETAELQALWQAFYRAITPWVQQSLTVSADTPLADGSTIFYLGEPPVDAAWSLPVKAMPALTAMQADPKQKAILWHALKHALAA